MKIGSQTLSVMHQPRSKLKRDYRLEGGKHLRFIVKINYAIATAEKKCLPNKLGAKLSLGIFFVWDILF